MNKEMLHRLKTAGDYQKKAVRALLPEEMGGHLDVIEKEVKMMAVEIIAELLKIHDHEGDACQKGQNHEQTSKVRKVTIV